MSGSEESGGGHLILETLVAIVILLFYTISAPLFEKYHFHYMHESGMCMIIGVIITLLGGFLSGNSNLSSGLKFNDEIFFTFILPPIIFAAGYNLNRRSFFKYFMYIFVFGVLGTIMTFSVVAPLTYLANRYNMFYFTFYDKNSFVDHKPTIQAEPIHNNTLPIKPEKTQLSSHLLLTPKNLLHDESIEIDHSLEQPKNPEEPTSEDINTNNSKSNNKTNVSIIETNNNITSEKQEKPTKSQDNSIPNTDKDIASQDKPLEVPEKPKPIKDEAEAEAENFYKDAMIHFSVKDILLFSAVISATDTVAALTFIKEDKDPKLFAILFGEGVLNDAVCIVLYRIIKEFTDSNEEFTSKTPFVMMNKFLNLFFFSFLVGTVVGIGSSLFLKKLKSINLNRVHECSIIIFFAFISYTLAEELGLSPIISLLFTGMFMSHYTFYNLSFQAREESSIVSKMMSNIAEAFVFTYLGLTVLFYMTHALSLSFIFCELIIVVLGRIIGIFGLSFVVVKLFKMQNFKLKLSEKGIMSCAGSIRGAIAFGLAISIDSKNRQIKEVLISSTLILVFLTTIFFGALMPFAIKFFKSFDKDEQSEAHEHHSEEEQTKMIAFSHPNFNRNDVGGHKEKNINVLKERLSYWLGTYWVEFDHVYMKPRLVHNWPHVKEENDELSDRILNLAQNYSEELQERKKKLEEHKCLQGNDLELMELPSDNKPKNFNSSNNTNAKNFNSDFYLNNNTKGNLKVSFLKEKNFDDSDNKSNEKFFNSQKNIFNDDSKIDNNNNINNNENSQNLLLSPKSTKSLKSSKSSNDLKNKNLQDLKNSIKEGNAEEENDIFKNMTVKK